VVKADADLFRLPGGDRHRDGGQTALLSAGIDSKIERVISPAWTTDWITAEGREKLRAYGIAPPVGSSGGRRAFFAEDVSPARAAVRTTPPRSPSSAPPPARRITAATTAPNPSTISNASEDRPMAAPRFHELEIAAVRNETPDAVAITFAIPEDLGDAFAFVPGQYLTLRAEVGGQDMRRSYSICSPLERERPPHRRRQAHRERPLFGFAQTLKSRRPHPGDAAAGPLHRRDRRRHDYLLLAAGSGITPCLSIAKSVLAGEPESTVTLLYANRNSSSVMFRDDLNDLKDRYTTRFTLLHVMDEETQDVEIMNGRLDAEKLETLASHGVIDPKSADAIYICGPEPMIRSASPRWPRWASTRTRIKFELFTPAPDAMPRPPPRRPSRCCGPCARGRNTAPRSRSSSTARAGRSRSTPPPTRCSPRP
jgi:ring-1,2-phenylacetyl-CoA epoxidase subunit PaaE